MTDPSPGPYPPPPPERPQPPSPGRRRPCRHRLGRPGGAAWHQVPARGIEEPAPLRPCSSLTRPARAPSAPCGPRSARALRRARPPAAARARSPTYGPAACPAPRPRRRAAVRRCRGRVSAGLGRLRGGAARTRGTHLSTTSATASGTATLIMAMCFRARRRSKRSIASAAPSTSRRACSTVILARARRLRTEPSWLSARPKAVRASARCAMCRMARSAIPIRRMQWWTRPGPRRPCAISKPLPGPTRRLEAGTRTAGRGGPGAREAG